MAENTFDLSVQSEEGRPRAYRAGLGLPSAVVIRSSLAPPRAAHLRLTETDADDNEASASESGSNAIYPSLTKETIWREWNINPAKHGPSNLTKPPTFVPSQNEYDELGRRSAIDGIGVEVDLGRKAKRKIKERENGDSVAGWYKALASGTTTPVSRTIDQIASDKDAGSSSKENPIVIEDDEDGGDDPLSAPSTLASTPTPTPYLPETATMFFTSTSSVPIRIHRKEWFIRRALASSSSSSSSSGSTSGPNPKKFTTIGSMLNISNSQPRVNVPQYVLGPENKGYTILRERLGWEGGGLGKPVGWEDRSIATAATAAAAGSQSMSIMKRKEKDSIRVVEDIVQMDKNGKPIVDLTVNSDSEGIDDEEELRAGGPGRTAPIATTLKLDRLGIGHRRTNSRANGNANRSATVVGDTRDGKKKVTHTIEEIREAQKRAKYGHGRGHGHGHGLELGKKGKIKWKERDKNERDHRRALAAALNA